MKIEKWIINGKEVEVPIAEEEDIEKNENISDLLENTLTLNLDEVQNEQ